MGKSEKKSKKRRSNLKRTLLLAVIGILVVAGALYAYKQFFTDDAATETTSAEIVVKQNLPAETAKKGTLKQFSGAEFRELYNNFAYPNTEYIADDAVITGDAKTDEHIQKLAEARGYIRRSAPVSDTFKVVQKDMKLQERAAEPWVKLQAAAKKDGISINLTAAYRSAAEQREIFLSRLGSIGVSSSAVTSGYYDAQINQVLAMTAIPGYSRHHTGYTIDIGCEDDPYATFELTTCFDWLSKDNYKQTKTQGWIPSYPEGAGKQGPEPESWEYVWVGTDAVTE